jgi:hypothetical protein
VHNGLDGHAVAADQGVWVLPISIEAGKAFKAAPYIFAEREKYAAHEWWTPVLRQIAETAATIIKAS